MNSCFNTEGKPIVPLFTMEITYLLFAAIYGAKSATYIQYTHFEYNTSTETCDVQECSTRKRKSTFEYTYEGCTEYTPITSALGEEYILNLDGDCMVDTAPCDVSQLKWVSTGDVTPEWACACPLCSCDYTGVNDDIQYVRRVREYDDVDDTVVSCWKCKCGHEMHMHFLDDYVYTCRIQYTYPRGTPLDTTWCPAPRCNVPSTTYTGVTSYKDAHQTWWDSSDDTCQTFCVCLPHNRTCMHTVCGHSYDDILQNHLLSSAFGVDEDVCSDTSQWSHEKQFGKYCTKPDTGPKCSTYTMNPSKPHSVTTVVSCLAYDDDDVWGDEFEYTNETVYFDEYDDDDVDTTGTGTPETSFQKSPSALLWIIPVAVFVVIVVPCLVFVSRSRYRNYSTVNIDDQTDPDTAPQTDQDAQDVEDLIDNPSQN
eukprot:325895_1